MLDHSEELHFVTSHAPAADLYNGNPAGVAVALKQYEQVSFLLQQKTAGTNTGTATVTVEECSAQDGTGAAAVAFRYRKKTTATTSDAWGAWTAASASGFGTTANENTIYEIAVNARDLSDGKPYARVKLTETVNDPVDGAVVAVLYRHRYGGIDKPTVLT